MKNKKLMIAVAAITMSATSVISLTACNEEPEHTHNFTDWQVTKAPTCTQQGMETGTCAADGQIMNRSIAIDPDAHSYGSWFITLPTTTDAGKVIKTCSADVSHIKEVDLPKLDRHDNSEHYVQSEERTESGEFTFDFKNDETIKFTQSLDHFYTGELTLCSYQVTEKNESTGKNETVTKYYTPTITQGGFAKKQCTLHPEDKDDYNLIYIPALGSGSSSISVQVLEEPTETTCGKGNYTFTHTSGETLVFENVEIPATKSVDEIFDEIFVEDSYVSLNAMGEPYNIDRIVSSHRSEVGKVYGLNIIEVGNNKAQTPYSYEFGDGFTYLDDRLDNVKYYYYNDGQNPVHGVREYSGEKPELMDHSYDERLDGVAVYITELRKTFYGLDSMVHGLYSLKDDPMSSNFSQGSYTGQLKSSKPAAPAAEEKQQTVYCFGFNYFIQDKSNSQDEKIKNYTDVVSSVKVEFTLDDNGRMSDVNINIKKYTYSYSSSRADENSAPDGALYEYVPEAAAARNPIKGYDTGEFYVAPGKATTTDNWYNASVTYVENEEDKIKSPYDFGDFETIENLTLTYTGGDSPVVVNPDGSTVLETTSNVLTNFTITDVEPKDLASIVDFKVYFVEDGKETLLDFMATGLPSIGYKMDNSGFSFISKKKVGDLNLKVKFGNQEIPFTIRVNPATPSSITPEIYAYSDLSDNHQTVFGNETTVFVGEKVYFNANTPLTDNDALTDSRHTVTLNGNPLEKEIWDGKDLWYFTAEAAGEYTFVITSTANPKATATVKVIVQDAPSTEELLAGKYKNDQNVITFVNGNTLTIKDNKGTATYSYTYDENAKSFTLTKTDGVDQYDYTLSFTAKYNLKLSYKVAGMDFSNIFVKGGELDALMEYLPGKSFTYRWNNMLDLSVAFDEGNRLTFNDGQGNSRSMDWTLKRNAQVTGKYDLVLTNASSSISFLEDEYLVGAYVQVVGNNLTIHLRFDFVGEWIKDEGPGEGDDKPLAPDEIYAMLTGNTYSFVHFDGNALRKYNLTFGEDKTVSCHFYDSYAGETEKNDFTYELIAGENGKYFFTFTFVAGYDDGVIHGDVSNNNNSWVIVSGGKITQILVKGVYNGDEVDAEFGDVGAVADATVALADTHWEYTHEIEVIVDWDENDEAIKDFVTVKITIDFHSDGSLDITREQSYDFEEDGPTSRTDTNYTWKLKENAEGKFDLEFTYTGTDYEMGECGLYSSTANNGSFITFENGEITGFTFHYDKGNSTELVQMQPATGMGPRSK